MIGERLKEIRLEHGYSRARLALELGVGVAGIARWETGIKTPRLETIEKIADKFGVSVDWLMGRSENKYVKKP